MKLLPFQREGVDWLLSDRRRYLADDMGLGKTVQAICAARELEPKSVRVFTRASMVGTWHEEWETWGGPPNLEVLSYASYARRKRVAAPTSLLICDEAHYLKTPSAKRTKAAMQLAAMTPHVWFLSATPMPKGPHEIWPHVKTCWPEVAAELGITSAEKWMRKFSYVRRTDYGLLPYKAKNEELFREAVLDRIMLRRMSDILDLPDLDVWQVPVSVGNVDLGNYEEYGTDEDAYVSSLRRLLGEAKAEGVARLVAGELQQGEYDKIVVFYHHTSVRHILQEVFREFNLTTTGIDGTLSVGKRHDAIKEFQSDSNVRVFLAQQQAAGEGITLTAATETVLLEPAWTAADNSQAIKRIHRIGQSKPCRARIFAVPGTLDDAIMARIVNRMKMEAALFGETT